MKLALLFMLSTVLLMANDSNFEFYPTLTADDWENLDAGEIIMHEIEDQDLKGQGYELVGVVNAPGQRLFNILADYENYPQFMTAVKRVEIFADHDTLMTLNYTLEPIFGLSKRYRIDIAANELKPGVWKLEWYLVPWPGLEPLETLADTKGYWLIIEQKPGRSLLQYYAYSDPGPLPLGLRSLVNALSRGSVKEVFSETRAWAERK